MLVHLINLKPEEIGKEETGAKTPHMLRFNLGRRESPTISGSPRQRKWWLGRGKSQEESSKGGMGEGERRRKGEREGRREDERERKKGRKEGKKEKHFD